MMSRITVLGCGLMVLVVAACDCQRAGDDSGGGLATPTESRGNGDKRGTAKIDDAFFTGTGSSGPMSRKEVVINGSYFNPSGKRDDYQTRIDHPVESQRQWKRAAEVKRRDGTSAHIVADHSAANERVEVRVKGADGNWSAPHPVRR